MSKAPPPKKLNYLLRDIPPVLWRLARHVAIEEDTTLRELLLHAFEEHCKKAKNRSGGSR